MFIQYWKPDCDEYISHSKYYRKGRNIFVGLFVALALFFNYVMTQTPVNAYQEDASSFTIEDFSDYKKIEQCSYSLTASKSEGSYTDSASGKTMSCVTLDNSAATVANSNYIYNQSSNKLYEASYYQWVNADDLLTGDTYIYHDNMLNGLLNSQEYTNSKGNTITIFNPTQTDYLAANGETWSYYKIFEFVPSWTKDNVSFYNLSSNGTVYYSIDGDNGQDSYYQYNKDGDVVYHEYAELADVKIDYLFYPNSNAVEYGNIPVDNYNLEYVTLSNVQEAYYKLQHYEQTYIDIDHNGYKYGNANFDDSSYYKDGIYYLWDTEVNKFYAYKIDTGNNHGFISESDLPEIEDGYTIITKDTANKLLSEIKLHRQYFETTYELTETETTSTGTTLESSKAPVSTSNSYTYYEISSNPVSYDSYYRYNWTYVSDYLYEYASEFVEQEYLYDVYHEAQKTYDETVITYSLAQSASEETTAMTKAGYNTSCYSLTSLDGSSKCYTSSSSSYVDMYINFTRNTYALNTQGAFKLAGELSSNTKSIKIGNTNYTVKLANGAATDTKTASEMYTSQTANKYYETEKVSTYTIKVDDSYDEWIESTKKSDAALTLPTVSELLDYAQDQWSGNETNPINSDYSYMLYLGEVDNYSKYYNYKYRTATPGSTYQSYSDKAHTVDSYQKGVENYTDYFYVKLGTSGTVKRNYTGVTTPRFYYLHVQAGENGNEDNKWYAAPVSSFVNKPSFYTASSITKYKEWDLDPWDCDGSEQPGGVCLPWLPGLGGSNWYEISETEYNNQSFAWESKSQVKLPHEKGKHNYYIRHYKEATNTYYDSWSNGSKTVKNNNGGTYTLYRGQQTTDVINKSYFSNDSFQRAFVAESSTEQSKTVKYFLNGSEMTFSKPYSISYTRNSTTYEYDYRYYSVNNNNTTGDLTYKLTLNTYYSDKGYVYAYANNYSASGVSKPNGTKSYKYTEISYTITPSATNYYDTGRYYISSNGTKQYYDSSSSSISPYGAYDNYYYNSNGGTCGTESSTIKSGSCIIKRKNSSTRLVRTNIYRPLTQGANSQEIYSFVKQTPSEILANLRTKEAVKSVRYNSTYNRLDLTWSDGTVSSYNATLYHKWYYYDAKTGIDYRTAQDYTTDYEKDYDATQAKYSTKVYGGEGVVNNTKNPKIDFTETPSTTGSGSTSIKTQVVQAKTTTNYRDRYKFNSTVDTSNKVKLYNSSANASLPSNYDFRFSGRENSLTGTAKRLVMCSSSSTDVCYRFISTELTKQLEEHTSSVSTNQVMYSQQNNSDLSHTSGNVAYYQNHIPTDAESGNSGYSRRICTSDIDTSCYRDNPTIETKFDARYSITTHSIKYGVKANLSTTPILYGQASSNSTTNTYEEFGKITGADYYNDSSFSGGSYTKTNTSGGISSRNILNDVGFFTNNNTSNLTKKLVNNNEYDYKGTGTITYTFNTLSQKPYTLSFYALTENGGKLNINGTSINLSNTYPSSRQSFKFTPTSASYTITFNVTNGVRLKMISVVEGDSTEYSMYARYRLDASTITEKLYQTHSIVQTYSYYDVTSADDNGGYSLTNSSHVIGYNNVIKDNGIDWKVGLVSQNESKAINYNYVLYGNDFNNNGTVDENEKYSGKNANVTICLDSECRYQYYLTGYSNNLGYTRSRTITPIFSASSGNYLDEKIMENVMDTTTAGMTISSTSSTDKKKIVRNNENGTYVDVSTDLGKYLLLKEYLNSSNENRTQYKLNTSNYKTYKLIDSRDFYKYAQYHDSNKIYNSVTKTYDKLDSGYTKELVFTNTEWLESIISTFSTQGYKYLAEDSAVMYFSNSDSEKLTQEALYAKWVKNNKSVKYTCADYDLGVSLSNCTFTNEDIEEITLDDLKNGNLISSGKYNLIIKDSLFNSNKERFRYQNIDYKVVKDTNSKSFSEYDKYLFGGYWQEIDIMKKYTGTSGYSAVDKFYNNVTDELDFYSVKVNDKFTLFVDNAALYIFSNASGTVKDEYSNSAADKYFYYWASPESTTLAQYKKKYNLIATYNVTDVYNELMTKTNNVDTTSAAKYLISGGIRFALNNFVLTQNNPHYVYELNTKSSDVKIRNVINLADLEILDMSDNINTSVLAGTTSDVLGNSTSYALRFSGMLNYWNNTINGASLVNTDDGVTYTMTTQNIIQKNSTIKFDEDTVSEFILMNTGANGSRGQYAYDLYGLTQILDNGNYYNVTLGGSTGNNIITDLVQVLNVLRNYGYTGYMYNTMPKDDTNIGNAEKAIEALNLTSNELINWSQFATNPEKLQAIFGNSSYANLLMYDYVGKYNVVRSSGGVTLYNAQTAFTSDYEDYYNEMFKALFSYQLYGYIHSDYGLGGTSYPHITELLSSYYKNACFRRGNQSDDSEDYLKDDLRRTFSNLTGKNIPTADKYGSNFWYEYTAVFGSLVDVYTKAGSYQYLLGHQHSDSEIIEIENPSLHMTPTLTYGTSVEEIYNAIEGAANTYSLELQLTSLLNYVAQSVSEDYVFVKSNTKDGRYYIYKKLETSDGLAPAVTVIRQNTYTGNGRSYSDSTFISVPDVNSYEYKELSIILESYAQKAKEEGFGEWVTNKFSSIFTWTGINDDSDEDNVVYALMENGFYESQLKIATINSLASFIWTNDMKTVEYKPVLNYQSLTKISKNVNTSTFEIETGVRSNAIDYSYIYAIADSSPDINTSAALKYLCGEGSGTWSASCSLKLKQNASNLVIDMLERLSLNKNIRYDYTSTIEKDENGIEIATSVSQQLQINIKDQYGVTKEAYISTPDEFHRVAKQIGLSVSAIEEQSIYEDEYYYSIDINFPYKSKISLSMLAADYWQGWSYDPTHYIHSTWARIVLDIIVLDEEFSLEEYGKTKLYTNGHNISVAGNNTFSENTIYNTTVEADITENKVSNDLNYNIGQTDFNITISDIIINSPYQTNSNYEYSVYYTPAIAGSCVDGFSYDKNSLICYYKSKDINSLAINSTTYYQKINYTVSYLDYSNDEEQFITNEIEINTNDISRLSEENIKNLAMQNAVESLYGIGSILEITSIDIMESTEKIEHFNTAESDVNVTNLPENSKVHVEVRKRFESGFATKSYSKIIETGDDMVLNPYGTSLKNISSTYNGDLLLKNETIPYALQKCLFTYDVEPTRDGVSVCGDYEISNKYRLQLAAPETIKIAFMLFDENGNNALNGIKDTKGIYFTENIKTPTIMHSITGIVTDTSSKENLFYYSFNDNDKKEFAKYNDLTNSVQEFVENYIFKNYTIGISKNVYTELLKKNRNATYTIKAVAYYNDRFTYLDYNQNGKYDESSLGVTYSYYDSKGVQVYYESANKTLHAKANLSTPASDKNSWNSVRLKDAKGNLYDTYKIAEYGKNTTYKYFIFGYDPKGGTHIVK